MLSLRKQKQEVNHKLLVATLVDWDMTSMVEKLEKQLKKAVGKYNKVASLSVNRINTFMVVQTNIKHEPDRDDRIATENAIKGVLRDYASKLNKEYRKKLVYNGDSDIYYDAFEEQGLDLKTTFYNRRHGLVDDIEDQIERIISTASLILWDAEGHDQDRLILPDVVVSINDHLDDRNRDTIPDIADLLDELIIANFAGYFLPYAGDILHYAIVGMNHLEDALASRTDLGSLPVHTERSLRNFIGSLSGLQESLKLLRRIVSRLSEVLSEIENEFLLYPSDDLHHWLSSLQEIDRRSITEAIDRLDTRITQLKPQLRMLLKSQGQSQSEYSNLFLPMIEIKAVASAIVQYTSQFGDLPSFTTLSDGIAFESVENEEYAKAVPESLVEVTKLFKMYRRGGSTVYALRGVDLIIHEGEFITITGPSGSGKTTLLNLLAGLDSPDRGAVYFKDLEINSLKDSKKAKIRRDNFSFIFQNYALIPHLDAIENVQLPIEMAGLSDNLKEGIQNLLEDVGIAEYADHKPAYLSGGQMQRLGIARALATRPAVIFADEPTGDLDAKTGLKIMSLLKQYHQETGVTIVLVTHNPKVAEFGTRNIHIEDGLVTSGTM